MTLVVDTSAIFAYLFSDDKFHLPAVGVVNSKQKMLMPYTVFEEVLALSYHRLGKEKAVIIRKNIIDSDMIKIVYIGPNEEIQIGELFGNTKRVIDYVDASVYWLSKKKNLPVFGFDRHFKGLDIELIPI